MLEILIVPQHTNSQHWEYTNDWDLPTYYFLYYIPYP